VAYDELLQLKQFYMEESKSKLGKTYVRKAALMMKHRWFWCNIICRHWLL